MYKVISLSHTYTVSVMRLHSPYFLEQYNIFSSITPFLSQFNRHAVDGLLSERDFGSILLTYAGLPDSKKSRMLKRVRKMYKDDPKVQSVYYMCRVYSVC